MKEDPYTLKVAYSIKEACKASSLGRTTIYGHIAAGRLRATRVGGRTLIPAEALHALINGEVSAMPKKQNPTTEGRVLRSSLVGASVESITLSVHRAQHLINAYGVRPEWAAILASMIFGGGDSHG